MGTAPRTGTHLQYFLIILYSEYSLDHDPVTVEKEHRSKKAPIAIATHGVALY